MNRFRLSYCVAHIQVIVNIPHFIDRAAALVRLDPTQKDELQYFETPSGPLNTNCFHLLHVAVKKDA